MKLPNPKTHFYLSMIKSSIRIISVSTIWVSPYGLNIMAIGFIIAEVLGIFEEVI